MKDEEFAMATQSQIEIALRERIKDDVSPDIFDPKLWKDVPFGRYYGDDDELTNIVVFETTEQVVNEEGRTLPPIVWRALIDEIAPDTTPKAAIPKMWLATLGAQFEMIIPPTAKNRPPTLKALDARRAKDND
jgi:hypothetical protein